MSANTGTAQREREEARRRDGQFGTQARGEPTVDLSGGRYFHQLENWAPLDSEHVPQANDLSKIVSVVDAVEAGVTSQTELGAALDMTPQQGSYYANAAEYLGLVEQDRTMVPFVIYTTSLGQDFQNSDAETRAAMVSQMVEQIDDVQTIRHHGGSAELLDDYIRSGLTDETAQRRVDMIRSWANSVQDSRELSDRFHDERSETRIRCTESAPARERRIRERQEREQARLIAGRQVNVANQLCGICFQTKPLSGICDNCD